MQIKELVKRAHENAVAKGFYPKGQDKNIGELLMLVVSELGEALEAHRHGKHGDKESIYEMSLGLRSNHMTHADNLEYFERAIKDTFEDELADTVIRIADLCGYLNIDLEKHIELKMIYNATREYKHGKKY